MADSDSGYTATDIITYIGIPLAVLGVLPTLYTCLKSIFTLRRIRKTLVYNNVNAITRSSLLSGIIEVEIPRKSIHPLARGEDGYFHFSDDESTLKGGGWTKLNWKELQIGTKCYRLQYHDELKQPAAEVEFEALIAFLLDRGAIPSAVGFADLRTSGLWTPTGTRLLLSPSGREAVLSVGAGEDGDGILSLVLHWRKEWDLRGIRDLPPYWTRVHKPLDSIDAEEIANEPACDLLDKPGIEDLIDSEHAEAQGADSTETKPEDEKDLIGASEDMKRRSTSLTKVTIHSRTDSHASSLRTEKYIPAATSIRLRLGPTGVEEAHYETSARENVSIRHLRTHPAEPSPTATWFSSAATALRAHDGGLWAYSIPHEVVTLARKEVIPCGVMCLLELLHDEQVPAWRPPATYDKKLEDFEANQKFQEKLRRQGEEMRMPPDQAQRARHNRFQEELQTMIADQTRKKLKEEKEKEATVREALGSQRLSTAVVASANHKWLLDNKHVREGCSIENIVEDLLWEMMNPGDGGKDSREVVKMLEAWGHWAEGGGMTRVQYDMVAGKRLAFARAACFLEVVRMSSSATASTLVVDMQECLRLWKKVRLG